MSVSENIIKQNHIDSKLNSCIDREIPEIDLWLISKITPNTIIDVENTYDNIFVKRPTSALFRAIYAMSAETTIPAKVFSIIMSINCNSVVFNF